MNSLTMPRQPRPVPAVRGRFAWDRPLTAFIILLAITYNLVLALVNRHVTGVTSAYMMVVETLIFVLALGVTLSRWRPEMTRWLLMMGAMTILFLCLSLFRGTIEPKSLRDMLLVAVFVMLGMSVRHDDARRLFLVIHVCVLMVMLYEVTFPESFGAFVDPKSYFIATRGFVSEQFYGDSDLFAAVRPDDRYYFPVLGWIRASSLFMEPLSLGNYCAIAVLIGAWFWKDFGTPARIALVFSWAVILVGSDSRFAGLIIALLAVTLPILRRLPLPLATLYLPGAVLCGELATWLFSFNRLDDNLPGRIARGVHNLNRLGPAELSGFTMPTQRLADSGIAYLVMAQSLLGVAILLLFLYLNPAVREPRQRMLLHGIALIFALSIMVSISTLSIKTAALLWFLAGMGLVAEGTAATASSAAVRPASRASRASAP